MMVAMHQPNFLPWLGYFYKLGRADYFVFSDTHAFGRHSYTNRVMIKTASGPQWLTVPVLTKGKGDQEIRETQCNRSTRWRVEIPKALEVNYRQCPHYLPCGEEIAHIIATTGDGLADLNIRLIEYIAAQLGIRTPTIRSSCMRSQKTEPTGYIIARCKELGADAYLSGFGGSKYQDEAAFAAAGIRLVYTDFRHPTYKQTFGEFAQGLSIVDLLFNCGSESTAILGI